MCREKSWQAGLDEVNRGSPLRVQGKGFIVAVLLNQHRITPACAGKSQIRCAPLAHTKDHPCVCREKLAYVVHENHGLGSPLRVQGKVTWNIFVNL